MPVKPQPIEKRFWSKVKIVEGDGCWEWQGMRVPKQGYGLLAVRFKPTRYVVAHRISYELACGKPVPRELSVLHTCDNPPCVRPSHLFLGTQADNNRDMKAKGRAARGTKHFRARLDPEKVRYIREARARGEPVKAIAGKVGVVPGTVYGVINGLTWGHVA